MINRASSRTRCSFSDCIASRVCVGSPAREMMLHVWRDRIDLAVVALRRAERRAVVEVGSAVPRSVPPCALYRFVVVVGPLHELIAHCLISARCRVLGEFPERHDQEPRQPHALSLSLDSDSVHSIVPVAASHERKPVLANGAPSPQRADAVIVQRLHHLGDLREVEQLGFAGIQLTHMEIGDFLVEYRGVVR